MHCYRGTGASIMMLVLKSSCWLSIARCVKTSTIAPSAFSLIGLAVVVGLRTDATTVVISGKIFYILSLGDSHSTTNMDRLYV